MPETNTLQARLDAEFASIEQKRKAFQERAVQTYAGREERFKLFEKVCGQLRDIWRPKLEMLAQRFGEQAQVTPHITRELRQATFDFDSKLARVQVRFTVSTDTDVQKLVLDYNLEILPILMKFEPHARAEFPLERVDAAAVGKWLDDRIVDFVQTFLAMYQNEYYLREHMVVDPVAGIQLPTFAAAATLERGGKTLYFISEQTREEFEQQESAQAATGKGSGK